MLTFDQPITDLGVPPTPADWIFKPNGLEQTATGISIAAGRIKLTGGGAVPGATRVRYAGQPPPIRGTTTQPLEPFTVDLPFP